MNSHYYNSFDEFETNDELKTTSFDNSVFQESSSELYTNRQNFQTVFLDNSFGKEGDFFFPGTFDEASLLLNLLYSSKNQKEFFHLHTFSPFLRNSIKNWSYSKLTCSALYYRLNSILIERTLEIDEWKNIAELIQSPVISRDVFSFVKKHNLISFSSKRKLILGIIGSLIFPPYISYRENNQSLPHVKSLYRLLKLADVDKTFIRTLVKITFTEQNVVEVLRFLDRQLHKKYIT